MSMETVDVEKIAEAVLYEGYLLFPYRRSAAKNQQRWTFGGVYPRAYSEATGGDDPWLMQTQCLVSGEANTEFEIKVRFLHIVERTVAEKVGNTRRFVEELRVGGPLYRPWEEASERTVVLDARQDGSPLRLEDLLTESQQFAIDIPAGHETEPLFASDGEEVGALVREWRSVQGAIEVSAEPLESPRTQASGEAVYRLTARIVNTTPCPIAALSRQDALRQTLVSTHTILRARGGAFLSLLEPPEAYHKAAEACANIKTWPVLVGEPGERHTLLSSPIILYDYPQIAPESQGNFFDATEIDELLTLSVLALTDAEKQEMRESGSQARAILERTESLSEEQLSKLHGAIRYLQPVRRND